MKNIIDFIRLNGSASCVSPGTLIQNECQSLTLCYFIESGCALIYSDVASRPIGTVHGPYIVGLSQILAPEGSLALKTINASTVYAIPAFKLFALIQQKNLWSVLAMHLSELVFELHSKTSKRKKIDASSVVFKSLQSLQQESEDVRIAYRVTDYVSGITGLSPSTVSRVLEDLKKQHRIEVHNGVLIRLQERTGD